MTTREEIYTDVKKVKCSGKDHPFDHPTVYLEMDPKVDKIECPYCSKVFLKKNS